MGDGGSLLLEPSKELCRTHLRTIHSRENSSLEQEGGWEHLPTDFCPPSVKGCSLGYELPGTSRLHTHEYEAGSPGRAMPEGSETLPGRKG